MGLLFAMPAVLGFLVFTLGPMGASLAFSFTNYSGVNVPSFIGFENYIALMDPTYINSLLVTLEFILMSVPLNITVSFFIALMLSQKIKARGFFRLAYYLPTIVPLVASSIVWRWILDPSRGIANYYITMLGFEPSRFLFSEETVLPTMAIMGIWQTGATMLIFLAGFQGIPRQLYEAADVDGGNFWHKFTRITIPLMTPSIFFNVVVGLIGGFQVFTQAFIITGGGPNNRSMFLVLLLFREAFNFGRMGRASAIAWVMFLLIVTLTIANFRISRKWVFYESGEKV